MSETRPLARIRPARMAKSLPKGKPRLYDAEAVALMSLRLIAAPNPEDDLSDEEIYEICKKSPHSSELIKQLIDFIKSM